MPANRKHHLPPPEAELPQTLHDDRHRLEEVNVPIVTISASFRSEIAQHLGEAARVRDEAVFSRAHYSMAIAVFAAANKAKLTAWLVDPLNYVSPGDWRKIAFTERLGEAAARIPLLKKMKELVDTLARRRLPVASAVTGALSYVTERTQRPIISLHYEAGNILASLGREVINVVTDPYVRLNYLFEAQRPNIVFAVFDQETKVEFLEKAKKLKKEVPADRVVVTGPPVDPRIVRARQRKKPEEFKKRGLRLVIATGGLGTNKQEIKTILENLLPTIAQKNISLILYAGTHPDFREMFYELPQKYGVAVGDITTESPVRVIFNPSIIRANQELVDHAFPWADGFVTKPSGDMAYDAVGAGCFLLSLSPWGPWEERIEAIFANLGILAKARPREFMAQLNQLVFSGWTQDATKKALDIDKLFLQGAKRIVDLQQRVSLQ